MSQPKIKATVNEAIPFDKAVDRASLNAFDRLEFIKGAIWAKEFLSTLPTTDEREDWYCWESDCDLPRCYQQCSKCAGRKIIKATPQPLDEREVLDKWETYRLKELPGHLNSGGSLNGLIDRYLSQRGEAGK